MLSCAHYVPDGDDGLSESFSSTVCSAMWTARLTTRTRYVSDGEDGEDDEEVSTLCRDQ